LEAIHHQFCQNVREIEQLPDIWAGGKDRRKASTCVTETVDHLRGDDRNEPVSFRPGRLMTPRPDSAPTIERARGRTWRGFFCGKFWSDTR
jgi:hypothetical protein